MGTAYYMAPEQTRGQGEIDERADVFSLGVIFFEMLTGRVPIGSFRVPTAPNRFITRGVAEIIKKALEPNIKIRFQSAKEMQAALKNERENIVYLEWG